MSNTNNEVTSDTAQKINKTFAPINITDRQAKRNFFNGTSPFKKRRHKARNITLSFGFILLIIIFGAFVTNFKGSRTTGGASNQVQSVLSGEELKDYTSPEHAFTILMPGIPEIAIASAKSDNKNIPVTTYKRSIENNDLRYTLAVYDYSGQQYEESKILENALNEEMKNTAGSSLKATQLGKYNELNALEATYIITDKEKMQEAHIRYVFKDSKLYAMILIGGNQVKFDQFANSLRLN